MTKTLIDRSYSVLLPVQYSDALQEPTTLHRSSENGHQSSTVTEEHMIHLITMQYDYMYTIT